MLLRAVNMHPYKLQVQHVDFQRVLKNKKMHMKVPLHFVRRRRSRPAVKGPGGVVSHVLNELDITCFPTTCRSSSRSIFRKSRSAIDPRAGSALPKGRERCLLEGENPVVATASVPKLGYRGGSGRCGRAAVPASEVPAAKQVEKPEAAVPEKAEKPAKGEKGDKGEKK